jgi:hypothetical protein
MAEETVGAVGAISAQNNAEVVDAAEPKVGEETPQANANEGETEHEQEKKRLGGWQRKIQKLEREVQTLRTAKAAPVQETVVETPKPKPSPKDFQIEGTDSYDVEAFTEALTDWKLDSKLSEVEKTRTEKAKAEQAKSEQQKTLEAWQQKQGAVAKAKHSDYDEVIGSADFNVSPLMHEAILNSEVGGELAYYLASNPDEAASIASMNSYQAAKALNKIEAQFAQEESAEQKEDEDEPPAPPVSKAPAPITPIHKPSPAAKPPSVYDKDLPYKEFVKLREAKLKAK